MEVVATNTQTTRGREGRFNRLRSGSTPPTSNCHFNLLDNKKQVWENIPGIAWRRFVGVCTVKRRATPKLFFYGGFMGKRYIPKHSTLWHQKLHRWYVAWENELYDDVTGIVKVYWNKTIIWLHSFTDFLVGCIDKHDKFWDKFEEKVENFYEDHIISKL